MPEIIVSKPFTLRTSREDKGRHFPIGTHPISHEELSHWFTQGCIAEGRAVVVPVHEQAMETVAPGAAANHDEFADAMMLTTGFDLAAPAKTTAKPKAKGK